MFKRSHSPIRVSVAVTLAVSLLLLWSAGESSARERHWGNPFLGAIIRMAVGVRVLYSEVQSLGSEVLAISAELAAVESELDHFSEGVADIHTGTQASLDSLQAQIDGMRDLINSSLADCVRVENGAIEGVAGPHVIIEGCNLHVRSGTEATHESNGRGNLIIGYNERGGLSNDCPGPGCDLTRRTGSHNLVLGRYNQFTSHGGMVAGVDNEISGPWATVSSGTRNRAIGNSAIITSGNGNVAHLGAWIGGGSSNTATQTNSVLGGSRNTAGGSHAVVVGGEDNMTVSGISSVVVGGSENAVMANRSVVVGGEYNLADDTDAVVLGGRENRAAAKDSVVLGGIAHTAIFQYEIAP